MGEASYIVAGSRPWNRRVFEEVISSYPGEWAFVGEPAELSSELVDRLKPRYIFFLHWSWRVQADILDRCECVCFHMTDVPYGRGGSPLQNLIQRGHRRTMMSALRMERSLDSGPVYCKKPLELDGSAEEIYLRATYLSAQMIRQIIDEHPTPAPQSGDVVEFKRRTPKESEISEVSSLADLNDFIRMLDAEGYPRAFLLKDGFHYEFSDAKFNSDQIIATVTITRGEGK